MEEFILQWLIIFYLMLNKCWTLCCRYTEDELIYLPNLIKLGDHELSVMNFIEQGPTSYYIDKGTYYILDGDNEWTSYSPGGNNNNYSDEVYIVDYEELFPDTSINSIGLLGN